MFDCPVKLKHDTTSREKAVNCEALHMISVHSTATSTEQSIQLAQYNTLTAIRQSIRFNRLNALQTTEFTFYVMFHVLTYLVLGPVSKTKDSYNVLLVFVCLSVYVFKPFAVHSVEPILM